jgi:nicotinate-nucleotide adenylyltransferase
MKIGLFFGTFNPIHIGHLIIAQAALNQAGLDKIWFVVSPSSPDKDYTKLLHEFDRFDLAFEATKDNPDFKILDVEFKLPRPSYTYLTIRKLKGDYPQNEFFIILGSDNFKGLNKWKNIEEIRKQVRFVVYPRPGEVVASESDGNELIRWIQAPLLQISATEIRDLVRKGKSTRYLIPEDAWKLMERNGFYKN